MKLADISDAELALRPHRISGPVADFLLSRGAITPGRAIPYSPDGAAAQRALADLCEHRIVKLTREGHCWFDLRTYYAVRAKRERMRAMMAVPLAILAAAVATLFYSG